MEELNKKLGDIERKTMYMRLSKSGKGFYFFSPTGKYIYYGSRASLIQMLKGEKKSVLISGRKVEKKEEEEEEYSVPHFWTGEQLWEKKNE